MGVGVGGRGGVRDVGVQIGRRRGLLDGSVVYCSVCVVVMVIMVVVWCVCVCVCVCACAQR